MKSNPHIFISFKSEEREVASRLKTALTESGFKVWWQEEIQCGHEWHGEIDKAIEGAAAIVVLWSLGSMESVWVKHEASQAIAKHIYAPVRIEVMEIESPYNRIQATDMFNWTGEATSPGYQNLLIRLKELMPPPVPVSRRITSFIRNQIVAIILFVITTGAFYLLLSQSSILKGQLLKQDSLLSNVQKTDKLLTQTKDSLDRQFKRVSELNQLINGNLTETSRNMAEQFTRAGAVSDNIQVSTGKMIENLGTAVNSLSDLDSSQKRVLNNIRRNLYPIDASKMNISYQVYWDTDNEYVKKYVERVLQFAKQQNVTPAAFRQLNIPSSPSHVDSTLNYSFDEDRKVSIRYKLTASNEVKVSLVSIKDNSPLMPDCSDSYEETLSSAICDQRLYLQFSKNYDRTKSYTDQKVLRFISFTDNKHNNCVQKKRYEDEPSSGNSTIEIDLQFDKNTDKLAFFHVTYKTNKIIPDINTGELISVIDLLDSDFSLQGQVGLSQTGIDPIQISDIIIATGGEIYGGIRFGSGSNIQDQDIKGFYAVYKLDKKCFNANIFKQ